MNTWQRYWRIAGSAATWLGLLASPPLAAAPAIDTAFGTSGTARIGAPWGYEDNPSASAMQADGKVLVAGERRRQTGGGGPFVMRFTADGALDMSFAESGLRLLDRSTGLQLNTWNSQGLAQVEVLGDGGLLVRGGRVIVRLTSQGSVDTSFGSNGYFTSSEDILGIVPRPDGTMLLLGASETSSGSPGFPPVLTRLSAQGQLDTSFGPRGRKVLSGLPPNFTFNYEQAFVARTDGGLVLLARATFDGGTFLLVGITPAGEFEASFGNGGLVSGYDLGYPDHIPAAAALTADGGLWLYHRDESYGSSAFLRLTRGGALDAGFGQGGRRAIDSCCIPKYQALMRAHSGGLAIVDKFLYPASSASGTTASRGFMYDQGGALVGRWPSSANGALAVNGYERLVVWGLFAPPSGGLLVAAEADAAVFGWGGYYTGSGVDTALLGFDSTGQWRQGYGRGDGVAIWNAPAWSSDWIDAILVEPDGRILAAGFTFRTQQEFLVTRFDSAGLPDSGFGQAGRYVPDPYQYAHFTGKARLARGPDGRLAVAAGVAYGTHGSVASVTAFRLSNSAAPLGGFSPALTPPNYGNADIALAAGPGGRIYYAQGGTLEARLPDGSLDASFGNGGKVAVPLPEISPGRIDPTSHAALFVAADETITLAISTVAGPWVYKFTAAGAPIQGFGEAGVFRYAMPRTPVYGLAVPQIWLFGLADGGLLLGYAGRFITNAAGNEESQFVVLRISADGHLNHAKTFSGNANWKLAALPDGSAAITQDQALYRMFADGGFDLSFGAGGAFALPMTRVDALGVDASGRLLVAGQDATSAVLQRYRLDANVSGVPVVEFYNTNLNHYFVTGGPGEIAAIEAGAAGPGWSRTGLGFRAYSPEGGVPIGAQPVCRFYGTPGRGPNSHFYTVDSIECELVKRDPGWTYEGTAFYILPPVDGQCATGTQPVYRTYNMRFAQNDSNHRYTPDAAVYAQMQAQGWAGEGVRFCGAL